MFAVISWGLAVLPFAIILGVLVCGYVVLCFLYKSDFEPDDEPEEEPEDDEWEVFGDEHSI